MEILVMLLMLLEVLGIKCLWVALERSCASRLLFGSGYSRPPLCSVSRVSPLLLRFMRAVFIEVLSVRENGPAFYNCYWYPARFFYWDNICYRK